MKIDASRGLEPFREKSPIPARRDPLTFPGSLFSCILTELMDCIEEFVLILDPELRVLKANRVAHISLGYAEDELTSKNLSLLVDLGERKKIMKLIREARGRRMGSAFFLTRLYRKIYIRFSVSPLAEAKEKPLGYLLAGRLTTMENLTKIPESASFLVERMLNGYLDPLFIIDGVSRTVIDCNTAALDALGFTRKEIIGCRLLDNSENEDDHEWSRALRAKADKAYAELGIFQDRLFCRQKNGHNLPFDLFCLPFFKPDGSLSFVIAMLFDRTTEEDREAELARLLDRANNLASDLAAIVNRPPDDEPRRLSALGFTKRQIEIARLVVLGASSKDIGFQLGIAVSTVRNHLAVMFKKLGVDSRMSFVHVLNEQRIRTI